MTQAGVKWQGELEKGPHGVWPWDQEAAASLLPAGTASALGAEQGACPGPETAQDHHTPAEGHLLSHRAGGRRKAEEKGVSKSQSTTMGASGQAFCVTAAAAPKVTSTPPGGNGDLTHRRALSTSGSFRTSHTSRTLGRKERS